MADDHKNEVERNIVSESVSSVTVNEKSIEQVISSEQIKQIGKDLLPLLQLDDDVLEILQEIASNFVNRLVNYSSLMAKHRRSSILQVQDVAFSLENRWNMVIPGFSSGEPTLREMSEPTEAHLKRMSLKRKAIRKFQRK